MENMAMATTLKLGDRSELVKKLQRALIGFGCDLGRAGADGSFGDATKAAVEGFQDAHGLPVTGGADPDTIVAMDPDPDTLDDLIERDAGQGNATDESLAVVDGDDVYLDPPVRLWPQYDTRWSRQRIAGPKTGTLIDW